MFAILAVYSAHVGMRLRAGSCIAVPVESFVRLGGLVISTVLVCLYVFFLLGEINVYHGCRQYGCRLASFALEFTVHTRSGI